MTLIVNLLFQMGYARVLLNHPEHSLAVRGTCKNYLTTAYFSPVFPVNPSFGRRSFFTFGLLA
jgi:hypothetical protein